MVGVLGLLGVLLVGVLLSTIGLPFLGLGIYRLIGERAARGRIEEVQATITRSELERYRNPHDAGDGDHELGGNDIYEPAIEFEYDYAGRTYHSDLTAYERRHGGSSLRGREQRTVSKYDPGETVTAYVDPERPGRGFLEREETSGLLLNLFLVGFGGAFALVGFVAGVLVSAPFLLR